MKSFEKAVDVLSDFNIVHVHGLPGELSLSLGKGVPLLSSESISLAANNIIIVGKAAYDSEPFNKARYLLPDADRIVFPGFGFHAENIRRAGIFNQPWNDEMLNETRVGGTSSGIPAHMWDDIRTNIVVM